jgi:hypothetical protein
MRTLSVCHMLTGRVPEWDRPTAQAAHPEVGVGRGAGHWCDGQVMDCASPLRNATVRSMSSASWLQYGGREVPGVLWRPDSGSAASVVLLGHGGSGHKRSERHARLATWFAACAGIASLAIDGPFHGDRAVEGGPLDYQNRVSREGAAVVHDRMRQD